MDPILAEMYGTNAPDEADLEKLAAAELAEALSDTGEIDLSQLDPEALEALAAEVLGGDGEVVDPATEELQKEAEADHLGRVMAHSFTAELRGIEKEAGFKDKAKAGWGGAKAGGRRFGELLKGGKKGEIGEMSGRRAGNSLKGARQMKGEAAKSHGSRAAVGAAAAFGAKKGYDKLKQSSALETMIEQRAEAILIENGFVFEKEAGGFGEGAVGGAAGAVARGARRLASPVKEYRAGKVLRAAQKGEHGAAATKALSRGRKEIGAAGAAAAGLGAAGFGAKKALEKKSSALDTLVEMRAHEILAENGLEFVEEVEGQEKVSGADVSDGDLTVLEQVVQMQAEALLTENGFEFEDDGQS